jgi:hypothetical protein
MRKRLLLAILVVLYTACLVVAGWKYTHPVRNLNSVVKNRWNSYSQQYILGYTRGFKCAKGDLGVIAETNKAGAPGVLAPSAVRGDLETKSLTGFEVEAKSIDELEGSRDGYHDVMDHIWENLK